MKQENSKPNNEYMSNDSVDTANIPDEYRTLTNEQLVTIYQGTDQYSDMEREKAFNILLENNMGLIMSAIKKFTVHYKTNMRDLIDIGKSGIFLAALRYDTSYDTVFSTFAFHEVYSVLAAEINTSASNNSSTHYTTYIKLVRKAIKELKGIHGIDYEPDEYMINAWIKSNCGKDVAVSTIQSCMNGIAQIDSLSTDDDNNKNILSSYDISAAEEQERQLAYRADIEIGTKPMTALEKFAFLARRGLYIENKTCTFGEIAAMMNKRPDYIKMNRGRVLTAYQAEKYYTRAMIKFRNNEYLSEKYETNRDNNDYLIAKKNTQFTPADVNLVLETANDIADCIENAQLPDGLVKL